MTTAPAYALIPPAMRHSVEQLKVWLEATPGYRPGMKMTKADMIVAINLARQDYWNKAQAAAQSPAPASRMLPPASSLAKPVPAHVRTHLCTITATECNAWLSTLPPVPLAGEEMSG